MSVLLLLLLVTIPSTETSGLSEQFLHVVVVLFVPTIAFDIAMVAMRQRRRRTDRLLTSYRPSRKPPRPMRQAEGQDHASADTDETEPGNTPEHRAE